MNTEWNEKDDKLKSIKPDTWPWKENNRWRKDETIINRLRTGNLLLTNGYLKEGLLATEYELCHSHAMTVTQLITGYTNLASLKHRFLNGSDPNTLKTS